MLRAYLWTDSKAKYDLAFRGFQVCCIRKVNLGYREWIMKDGAWLKRWRAEKVLGKIEFKRRACEKWGNWQRDKLCWGDWVAKCLNRLNSAIKLRVRGHYWVIEGRNRFKESGDSCDIKRKWFKSKGTEEVWREKHDE